jgi:tetratricopeptide (TPR) repeat protein
MLPALEVSPRTFSLIFPALFVAVLAKQRPAWVFWLCLMVGQVLWTNIHGSFLVGPLLCAAFALQASRVKSGPYSVKQLLSATGLTALVTLINPYGPALHVHVTSLISAPGFASGLDWISPFHTQFGNSLLKNLTTVILVVGAIGLGTYRQKLPLALTCMAIGAAAATTMVSKGALVSVFIPMMSLLIFPFICLSISAGADVIIRRLDNSGLSEGALSAIGSGTAAILFLVTICMLFSNQYYRAVGSAAAFGLGVDSDSIPSRAAEVIGHASFPERAANLPIDAGYLAYRFPERKIFADLRPRGQVANYYKDLLGALSSRSDEAQNFWLEHDIDAIILNTLWYGGSSALAQLLSTEPWRLVYFDGTTAILVRNKPEYAALLENVAIRQAGLEAIKEAHTSYREAIGSPRGAPINARLVGAGTTFFLLHQYREAYAALEPVVLNAPTFSSGWYMLGVSQLKTGEDTRAVSSLEQACDHQPESVMSWLWLSVAYANAGKDSPAAVAFSRASDLNPEEAREFGNPVGVGTGSPPRP